MRRRQYRSTVAITEVVGTSSTAAAKFVEEGSEVEGVQARVLSKRATQCVPRERRGYWIVIGSARSIGRGTWPTSDEVEGAAAPDGRAEAEAGAEGWGW